MSAPVLFLDLGWLALLFGVFLAVYLLCRKLIELLPLQPDARAKGRRALPLFGLLLCFAYSLFAARTLFRAHELTQGLALLFVVAAFAFASQRLLRDYFAGVALIAEQSCRLGDQIRALGVTGRVVELGTRSLTVESQEGDRAVLPYSKLMNEPIIVTKNIEAGTCAHTFCIERPEIPLSEVARLIEKVTQAHHWSAIARAPEIQIAGSKIDVTIYSISKTHVLDIEAAIQQRIRAK